MICYAHLGWIQDLKLGGGEGGTYKPAVVQWLVRSKGSNILLWGWQIGGRGVASPWVIPWRALLYQVECVSFVLVLVYCNFFKKVWLGSWCGLSPNSLERFPRPPKKEKKFDFLIMNVSWPKHARNTIKRNWDSVICCGSVQCTSPYYCGTAVDSRQ